MAPCRIVQIHWGFAYGGVAQYAAILQQLSGTADLDIRHLVLRAPSFRIDEKTLAHLPTDIIPFRGRFDPSWIWKTVAALRCLRPDLIMTHGYNGHVIAKTCALVMRRHLPLIASWHGPYHPNTTAGRLVAPALNRLAYRLLRRDMMGVTAVADFCRRQLLEHDVPPERVHTIHNGLPSLQTDVPTIRKHLREEWHIPEKAPLLGLASRLDPVKGVDVFLRSWPDLFRQNPDLYAVICGDGNVRSILENQARTLPGSERIIFAGYRTDVAACLCAWDVFVLPSLFEYHSIALLEAMRAGCAIVATDVGGNGESIRHEQEGLLVPAGDTAALGHALEMLIAHPELRARYGQAARERFGKAFTTDRMLSDMRDWFHAMHARAVDSGRAVAW